MSYPAGMAGMAGYHAMAGYPDAATAAAVAGYQGVPTMYPGVAGFPGYAAGFTFPRINSRAAMKAEDCRYWRFGSCARGDTCFYKHDASTLGIDRPGSNGVPLTQPLPIPATLPIPGTGGTAASTAPSGYSLYIQAQAQALQTRGAPEPPPGVAPLSQDIYSQYMQTQLNILQQGRAGTTSATQTSSFGAGITALPDSAGRPPYRTSSLLFGGRSETATTPAAGARSRSRSR